MGVLCAHGVGGDHHVGQIDVGDLVQQGANSTIPLAFAPIPRAARVTVST